MRSHLIAAAVAVLAPALGGHAGAAEGDDLLKPYLAEPTPGPQSAHEMLGVTGSAVANLQSPKDWLGVLGTASGDGADAGFGLAFTPGRSDIRALAVSIGRYTKNDLARLWGATSFSYARNKAAHGGADYRQSAFFVQTSYYLDAADDPVVAAYEGVARCTKDKEKSAEFAEELQRRRAAERRVLGRPLDDAEIDALEARLKAELTTPSGLLAIANRETRACAQAELDAAAAKWNASRVGIVVGRGWIEGTAAGAPRLSLGRHVAITGTWAPKGWGRSLFTLTARRASREVDLDTLATTPRYRAQSQAALRFTYDAGTDRNAYVLAEASHARGEDATQSNRAFRQALGIDYRVMKGVWVEFRWGRAREDDGSGLRNRSLLNLKFSPEAGLRTFTGG